MSKFGKLNLNYKLMKPFINAASESDTENYILFEVSTDEELKKEEVRTVAIDFCLVLDVSGSMREPFEGGMTKLDAAVKAAEHLYDFIGEKDTISVVLYDSQPHLVLNRAKLKSKSDYEHILRRAYNYGGSTNISAALAQARQILKASTDSLKRVIFLTDGLPTVDTEQDGIREGLLLAQDGVVITALGIGRDFNYNFIQELTKPSRGTTDHLKTPNEAISIFAKAFKSAKSTVVSDVELTLQFSEKVRVGEYYRVVPETTYYGKCEMDNNRTVKLKIDDIEYNRLYKYLFQIIVPKLKTPYEGKFRIATAKISYSILALNQKQEHTIDIVIEHTHDVQKYSSELQTLRETVMRCQINKLFVKLDEAVKRGDKKSIASILEELIEKTRELGEIQLEERCLKMKEDYIARGIISNEDLIRLGNESTKVNGDGTMDMPDFSSVFNSSR
ncbi:vWA domain-containing protein [Pseudothermotoga sp.]